MRPNQTTSLPGPDEPHLNRRQRRARGQRGPVVPEPVTRAVATQLGITPQEVTAGYLTTERMKGQTP